MGKLDRSITLSHTMGVDILRHLSGMSPLPETGILAGQAVASSILDLWGDGGGIYNDIDVFQVGDDRDLRRSFGRAQHMESHTVTYTRAQLGYDPYHQMTFVGTERVYHVLFSEREGMVNRVACDSTSFTAGQVISSFDLNCVQVGIDLASQQLVWSNAFAQFLKGRQIEVVNLQTPLHTALRYFKKLDEINGAYGDDDFAMHLCGIPIEGMKRWHFSGEQHGQVYTAKRFGSKHADMWLQYVDHIGPYFDLVADGKLHSMKPVFQLRPEAEEIARRSSSTELAHAAPRLLREALRPRSKKVSVLVDGFKERFNFNDAIMMWCDEAPSQYLRGHVTERHATSVNKLVREHINIWAALDGLTLDQQYQARQWITAEARAKGKWVYGYVEVLATAADMQSKETFDAFMAREVPHGDADLVTPLLRSFSLFGFNVSELTTATDLMEHGEWMSHCVGGYAPAVKHGRSRIVQIRYQNDPKMSATLELRKWPGTRRWYTAQLRSHRNGYATSKADFVADVVEGCLNNPRFGLLAGAGVAVRRYTRKVQRNTLYRLSTWRRERARVLRGGVHTAWLALGRMLGIDVDEYQRALKHSCDDSIPF